MTSLSPDTARFRSVIDFPKNIQTVEPEQANALYEEMRDCLIFTNRSRAQLVRRNAEHKGKTLALRSNIDTLQGLINQLQAQKQTQVQEHEAIIAQLSGEMTEMSTQLDTLSEVFDSVGDVTSEGETHWGHLMFPTRITKLLQAVKAVMQWWKTQDDPQIEESGRPVQLIDGAADEQDKRDYPERYTDQASINRSLLDR